MTEELEALKKYREVVLLYVEEKISWVEFWGKYPEIMTPFDPLDWGLEGLSKEQQMEANFYSEWRGGEFGESDDKIPNNPNWEYGKSTEPFGWVDKEAYYKEFTNAFSKLRNEIGI